jgi:hypothetical protein
MRHAFLVTAYRDLDSLKSLTEQLLEFSDSYIFINIDGRSKTLISQFQNHLKQLNNPRINLQTRVVRWGSYEHFDVFIEMAQKALEKKCTYFHTITGQCRIIKSTEYFEGFFDMNAHQNYIQHIELPDPNWDGLKESRLDRIKYYQLHDILDAKRLGIIFRVLNSSFKLVQKIFGVDRLQDRTYFSGIVYFSINQEAMQYLETQWQGIKKEFKYTFCCEETVPQTILLNSPSYIKDTMINFDLRYILWDFQNGENPGILDERNLSEVRKPEYLFARKFDSRFSSNLVQALKKL